MTKESIRDQIGKEQSRLKSFRVKTLALFGSAIHDELRPESDLDFLVEFDGPARFDDYMDLKFFLEDALGRPVDLVTKKSLKPALRRYVERDMMPIYAS